MKRRDFLKFPMAAAALAMMARAATPAGSTPERAKKGLWVGSQKDRFDEELLIMGGRFDLKISGRDTGGDLCLYDTYREIKGGPALHRHYFQDEWFYIIRGQFIARVGEQTFHLGPGDSALAPRTVPHAFAKVSEGEGQMLVLFQPAGSMEDFFHELKKIGSNNLATQKNVPKEVWDRHGMEVLGPPLAY